MEPQVKENNQAKIMWEIPIQTDVTVTHNRPDLIYIDKANNNTYLIDISVPSDYNIGAKEIEKLSKYHLLKTEIRRLWNTQSTVIPIIIGATGIISKSLHRYIDELNATIDITILQKQAAFYTTTILSKVLGDTVFVNNTPVTPQSTSDAPGTLQTSHTVVGSYDSSSSSRTQILQTNSVPRKNTINARRRGRR